MVTRVLINSSTLNVSKPTKDAATAPFSDLLLSLNSRFGQVIQSGYVAATATAGTYRATVTFANAGAFVDALVIPIWGGVWVNYAGVGWTRVYWGYSTYERETTATSAVPRNEEFNTTRTFSNNSLVISTPDVQAMGAHVTVGFNYYIFRKPLTA